MSRFAFGLIATTLIYVIPWLVALGATAFILWDGNFATWAVGARFSAVAAGSVFSLLTAVFLELEGSRRKLLDRLHDEMREAQ